MIRKAKVEDLDALGPLILVILKDMELPMVTAVGDEQILAWLKEAGLDKTYRYSYARAIVAEEDGVILGAAFGYPAEDEPIIDDALDRVLVKHGLPSAKLFIDPETLPDEWYLDTISVSEQARGKGIGSQLLSALPEYAEPAKPKLGLNVDEGNPQARKLYSRMGFEKVGEMMISGHRYDHMQKKIH